MDMKRAFFMLLIGILFVVSAFAQKEEEGKKSGINKIQDNRIMFLNAYNFDFGNTSVSSNYVGHLNLFSPSLNKKDKETESEITMNDERWGWGFNTGILKINYNQKDSSNTFKNFKENVFINPFDELKDSIKYLKQVNNYKVETKNTVWSFYVQPTFELTKASNMQHIYIHGHAELLAIHWSSSTSIVNVKQDTGLYTKAAYPNFVIRSRLSDQISSSSNTLSGYFGAGVTFDLKPWSKGSFFFQPTLGFTTNKPSSSSTDIATSIQLGSRDPKASSVLGKTWNSFYLVRAYYTHAISKTPERDGSTIVIAMDIRGFFPVYAPQYAAYIGLNVGLDSILDLIKGTNSK
jgi:hypothetical protein